MKKFLTLFLLFFLMVEVGHLSAQSTNTSTSSTEQIKTTQKKKGLFSWLFNWFGSKKKNDGNSKESQTAQPEYIKMDQEELNYRFIQAAINADKDAMIKLLRYGANINATNSQGRTALIEVCRLGTYEIAKWLIDRGASVNYKDMYDGTALIYATQAGKRDIVNLLIQNGARKEIDY